MKEFIEQREVGKRRDGSRENERGRTSQGGRVGKCKGSERGGGGNKICGKWEIESPRPKQSNLHLRPRDNL